MITNYLKEQQGSLIKWKRTILSNDVSGSCHGNRGSAREQLHRFGADSYAGMQSGGA